MPSNDEVTYPYLHISDIAQVVGVKPKILLGDEDACSRLEIPLYDGRTLLLQTGDAPHHYRVECI